MDIQDTKVDIESILFQKGSDFCQDAYSYTENFWKIYFGIKHSMEGQTIKFKILLLSNFVFPKIVLNQKMRMIWSVLVDIFRKSVYASIGNKKDWWKES